MSKSIDTIIFDLGAVLIDWNPEYVFNEQYFDSSEKKKYFFEQVCTSDWNEQQDAGRSIVEATLERIDKFPEWENAIRDFYGRWTDMLGGPISATVEIFRELRRNPSLKIYALTNWQADLFNIALVRYDFLQWFDGRVVSGEEKTRKPFPEFYQRLFDRYDVNPVNAFFIDDNYRNIEAGRTLGLQTHHFKGAAELRQELADLGLFQ